MMSRVFSILFLICLVTIPAVGGELSFNRDIRPIFTSQCISCHGGVKEAGGISFVFREQALAAGESGNPTIIPGKPDQSELMKRVTCTDPDDVMPKPERGPPLKAGEIAKLRQWIAEGAKWQEHWAFEKPVPHPVPVVRLKDWPKNDIDAFVLARLEQENLKPSPQAEPALLLRRLSFDLIGLPPTLSELDAFEAAWKTDPDIGWQKEIDRLLASPHYGERWAANWLDLTRYADSEGLGLDRQRTAWPFRDWVIRAYNADLPFDQFTIKQLAGDLLPDPSLDDLIATNFHRHTQANAEGGTDDEEFRTTAVMDRVATTWETWQGVTMGCVQCHSHPYDPIHHEEYYKSFALFNNARDADLDQNFPLTPIPKDPARAADFAAWLQERKSLRLGLHNKQDILRSASKWQPVATLEATSQQVEMEVVPGEGNLEFRTASNVPNNSIFDLRFSAPAGQAIVSALRVELLPVDPINAIHTPEWGAMLTQILLHSINADGTEVKLEIARVVGDEPEPFFDPDDSLRANGYGWGPYTKIDRPRSCILILTQPLALNGQSLRLTLHQSGNAGGAVPLVAKRGRIALTDDARWTDFPNDPAVAKSNARIAEINSALAKESTVNLPTIQSMPANLERQTHLFVRGNWLTKDADMITPGIPALFGKLPQDPAPDRLAFAKWLVSADNPLAARVVVNRLWEQLFGFGLVETLEDFGSSGSKPSHPELLDHLALRLRDHYHWSQKAILREIVSSATYRQSAATTSEAHAVDPQNRLLARGPRVRLSAEAVRDQGLVCSGLFGPALFGPPVFPPMPPGGWTPFKSGDKWATPAPGQPDRYRRAIYTYTKRSNPYPGFATFDAPPRDLCTKRRVLSNTPLQALEALNSPAHTEFSQSLARRMKDEIPGDLAAKLAAGHRITTSRQPSPGRLAGLAELYQELQAGYTAKPALMAGMAGTPDGAAFTVLASVLLNLDEAVVK